jgi:hypothetical protein
VIQIDSFVLGLSSLGNQRISFRLVQLEAPLQHSAQLPALDVGDVAVNARGVDEERRSRKPIVVVIEMRGVLAAVGDLREEFSEALEHHATRTRTAIRAQ